MKVGRGKGKGELVHLGFKPQANSESLLKEDWKIKKFSPLKWTLAISKGIDSLVGGKRSVGCWIGLF